MSDIMQFFEYKHLPEKLQAISAPFGKLAHEMNVKVPNNSEKGRMMRRLLDAKDCAVRAAIWIDDTAGG